MGENCDLHEANEEFKLQHGSTNFYDSTNQHDSTNLGGSTNKPDPTNRDYSTNETDSTNPNDGDGKGCHYEETVLYSDRIRF